MHFLFDTNILIPLEPTSPGDLEPATPNAVYLIRSIYENGHQVFVHPASLLDLERDRNVQRRELRKVLLNKYSRLEGSGVSSGLVAVIGESAFGSNDYCDDLLLDAVFRDAVDWLVTEDERLRKKAQRAGLSERILSVQAAIQVVSDLSERPIAPPPDVECTKAYNLDCTDPIFDGLRQDYPGFDAWFARCRREHRLTWIIRHPSSSKVGALCLVKPEDVPPGQLRGRTLKICTFKVSDECLGYRYGELLLKTIFEHIIENKYDWGYVTVFPRHEELLRLLEDFGFAPMNTKTELGEYIYVKPFSEVSDKAIGLSAFEYHVRYGPRKMRFNAAETYLVPIRPQYADRLFPETADYVPLFRDTNPCGSAIRKAYLCHSLISSLKQGSILLFYRSQSRQGLIAVGVVESACRSRSPSEIARLVARRTVYTMRNIEQLCTKDVLVVLFRQSRIFRSVVPPKEAIGAGIMTNPPQSVMKIREEGAAWIHRLICQ